MKVEVEVLYPFSDNEYGKQRKIGDKFICDKELALKRRFVTVGNKEISLIKILRVVPDNTPEEPKVENNIQALFNGLFENSENKE